MSREIKFRAWDQEYSDQDGMHYDIYFVDDLIYIPVCDPESSVRFEMIRGKWYYWTIEKDFVIMQYTGLKDKNNKEIYEGDIVKIRHLYVVEYDDDRMRFQLKKNNFAEETNSVFSFYNTEDFEVIGNIFENPELLEG